MDMSERIHSSIVCDFFDHLFSMQCNSLLLSERVSTCSYFLRTINLAYHRWNKHPFIYHFFPTRHQEAKLKVKSLFFCSQLVPSQASPEYDKQPNLNSLCMAELTSLYKITDLLCVTSSTTTLAESENPRAFTATVTLFFIAQVMRYAFAYSMMPCFNSPILLFSRFISFFVVHQHPFNVSNKISQSPQYSSISLTTLRH